MSCRGHRKLRLSSKKNYERKKYDSPSSLVVSVSLAVVSVFKVSVPLTLLPLKVSLPVSSFKSAPARSTATLHDRLRRVGTLKGMSILVYVTCQYASICVHVARWSAS